MLLKKCWQILLRFYQKHSEFSLKSMLTIVFSCLITIIVVITSLVGYSAFSQVIANEIGKSRVDVLRQIGERTRVIKSSAITLSNLFYYDNLVNQIVNSTEPVSRGLVLSAEEELLKTYDRYSTAYSDINIIFQSVITAENGFNFYGGKKGEEYTFSGLKNELWYKEVVQKEGGLQWISGVSDYASNKKILSAARVFINKQTKKPSGVLLINMDERLLFENCKTSMNGINSIYIIDEKGAFVTHQNVDMLGINFYEMSRFRQLFPENTFKIIEKEGKTVLFSNYFDPETKWTIIEEYPVEELFAPVKRARNFMLTLLGIGALLSFGLSYYAAGKIAKPMFGLSQSMRQVEQGDLDVISNIKGWKEVNHIRDAFNQMVENLKILIEDNKYQERQKHKAEIQFLQAQINPHFLHNTLFSIKCMMTMGKNKEAEQMMSAFIKLMHLAISESDEFVTIAEELECLKQYLLIQKHRYGGKFDVFFEFDEDTYNCMIPKLIMQPVLENAIFHGIEPKDGQGELIIIGFLQDKDVVIEVTDDGVGMDKVTLHSIWDREDTKEDNKGGSIGIINVHKRIKLLFGENYGVSINSEPGQGTQVHIRLPNIVSK